MVNFSGIWEVVEWDDESFLKFFAAMGAPDPNRSFQLFKTVQKFEIIDKEDLVILRTKTHEGTGVTGSHLAGESGTEDSSAHGHFGPDISAPSPGHFGPGRGHFGPGSEDT
uniref:Cytosolic fatty-acid binding proteins domain-containing protein n=1 Tax=Branchiostoma floridae TaxID=7739 RepID=C3Z262_BRAFL|eukprot:XP_002597101.1 hypothetical protein BRAFLDRAFT_121313 [Branchiostoma floridae]